MAGEKNKRLAKTPNKWKKAVIAAAVTVAVLGGGYLGLCAWTHGGDTILPNITAVGLDISGMTVEEATKALEDRAVQKGGDMVVSLKCDDWSGEISGAQLEQNWGRMAKDAYEVGHTGFLSAGGQFLSHALLRRGADIPLEDKDQPALDELIHSAEEEVNKNTSGPTWEIKGDQMRITKGNAKLEVDSSVAYPHVMKAFDDLFKGQTDGSVPQVEMPIKVTKGDQLDLKKLHEEVCVEPADAVFDKATGQATAHVVGIQFDLDEAEKLYDEIDDGEETTVPLTLTQPKETTASLNSKLFRDVLGKGTSRVKGSANRKTNIKLSAAACNGVVLLPGEVFSYNGTTGSRSASKGYLPAPVYSGGASVDDVGGGICQTSSTIYYAVLHSTLEVVERRNHMYAVGYVPDGMDATVYYGSTDFRFKNNTNYPVKVVTKSYDQGGNRYLSVTLLGTNESGQYAVPNNQITSTVEPTTKYVANDSIPRGTTQVDHKQNPYRGRQAVVTRTIYNKDGSVATTQKMGTSNYKMRPKTIYYNPLDGNPSSWPNGVPPKPAPVTPPTPAPEPAPEQPVTPPAPPAPAPDPAAPAA